MIDSFSKHAGPAGYYRWLVATRFLGLPVQYPGQASLDIVLLTVDGGGYYGELRGQAAQLSWQKRG